MKQILLHVTEEEKVLAVLDEGVLSDISVEKAEETDLVGRVYKGVIRNVVPSINGISVSGRTDSSARKISCQKSRIPREPLSSCRWRRTAQRLKARS